MNYQERKELQNRVILSFMYGSISHPHKNISKRRRIKRNIKLSALVIIVGTLFAMFAYHFTSLVFATTHTPDEIRTEQLCGDKQILEIVKSHSSDAMKHESIGNCYSKRIENAHKEIETLINYAKQ